MICADFLAGSNLANGNPEILLSSMTRFFEFLPSEQQRQFLLISQLSEYKGLLAPEPPIPPGFRSVVRYRPASGFRTLELQMTRSSRAVASPRVVSIEDFRPIARQRVPKPVFDYLDGGAEGEVTLRENCRVFNDVTFRPRHAVALPGCDLRTRVLGFDLSLPILLAPVGYSRLMHPRGEVAAA
jgi:hypothetical protein